MATYTAEQSKVIHNYQGYLVQIGPSFSAYTSMPGLSSFGGNTFGGNLGRKRRQADFDYKSDMPLSNKNDYESNIPLFGQNSYTSNTPSVQEQAKNALKAFDKMDPVFGYSFYVAWVGMVFATMALLFGVLGCLVKSSTSYDRQPLPVL